METPESYISYFCLSLTQTADSLGSVFSMYSKAQEEEHKEHFADKYIGNEFEIRPSLFAFNFLLERDTVHA